jgi:hypothetical protein
MILDFKRIMSMRVDEVGLTWHPSLKGLSHEIDFKNVDKNIQN